MLSVFRWLKVFRVAPRMHSSVSYGKLKDSAPTPQHNNEKTNISDGLRQNSFTENPIPQQA